MSVFSDEESGLFVNEDILSTEHLPEMLPHRENDVQQLAHNMMPASRGSKPQNTFIFGPPGIGKTAVVKYVFREFEEYSERVRCIYVNCWDYRTSASLLTQLIIELGVFVQRRGWSRDEIMQKLVEALNKRAKAMIVCLDEVDQLDTDALYDLLRINQYVKTPVGIVFISNNPHVFAKAEPRIQSSLGIEELEFRAYSMDEMKDILGKRAKEAFRAYDAAVVTLAANQAVQKGGDVRIGLQCLMKAGRAAERRNARKVGVDDIKTALRTVDEVKPQIIKDRISEHERLLLDALKDGKKRKSGELYEGYRGLAKKAGVEDVTDRALRDFVNHLAELGMLEMSDKKIGKSRLVWLKEKG
jgi:cell division control protein 6